MPRAGQLYARAAPVGVAHGDKALPLGGTLRTPATPIYVQAEAFRMPGRAQALLASLGHTWPSAGVPGLMQAWPGLCAGDTMRGMCGRPDL